MLAKVLSFISLIQCENNLQYQALNVLYRRWSLKMVNELAMLSKIEEDISLRFGCVLI